MAQVLRPGEVVVAEEPGKCTRASMPWRMSRRPLELEGGVARGVHVVARGMVPRCLLVDLLVRRASVLVGGDGDGQVGACWRGRGGRVAGGAGKPPVGTDGPKDAARPRREGLPGA